MFDTVVLASNGMVYQSHIEMIEEDSSQSIPEVGGA